LLGSRWFVGANVVVLALVSWAFVGEYGRARSLQHEIDELNREAERLEAGNMEMAKLGQRLLDGGMVEREARLKLGLRKPGEEVVVVRGIEEERSAFADAGGSVVGALADQRSNTRKWLEYFFRKEKNPT